ncbi:MAG TPA: bifunctional 4-hydroxy-3-methylbut-2-enyl diphosphate reductase/30S ribosomal protein S1 [Ruminococcus sp.]|nr:bifunctional 4-hydroxy-3-methylbut-2-enyl diphosphate reductase/30S ribosomal protein S1 [Ruminococcus sp.]
MPEITLAKSAGFCFGVDRAVKLVYKELDKGGKVCTLGPIIHNQNVVDDLKKKGVRIIEKIDELEPDERVVIRSHGVGKSIYDEIAEKGNQCIDATCPFVSKIHKIVREKSEQGYEIMIAGDLFHPEVEGIVGHCIKKPVVFSDEQELKKFFLKNPDFLKKKVAIVAQTTYNIIRWRLCLDMLPKDNPDIEIFETICNATAARQSNAIELAKKSDAMIVIGGMHSSNTVKLYNVCSQYCPSYHIEDSGGLDGINLSYAKNIGITAGASTPAYIIKEVQSHMSENLTKTGEENFEEMLEQTFKKIHTGEKVTGKIVKVDNNEVIVDLGTKHTGYVSLDELTNDPDKKPSDIVSVDDEVEFIVLKVNDQEGTAQLSKKKVDELAGFDNINKACESGEIVEGTVQNVVKGGILVSCLGVRVFVPASQTGVSRDGNLESLLKKKVNLKILEVNMSRHRAVGSIRAAKKAEKDEAQKKFWETAEVGAVYKGEVKSITNYGAFVDLGGIDGMVHISELSWNRIKHPSEVVKIGDVIEVYIKDLDKESGRISLGYKKNSDNPWEKFRNEFSIGDVVPAKIVSITPFGAFAQIIEGVDGLIHISQLADKRVDDVKEIVQVGQTVNVKITDVDYDKKRISISMRALIGNNGENSEEEAE